MSSALSFAIAEVLSDSLGASAELRNDAALREGLPESLIKPPLAGSAIAAYICDGFACRPPISIFADLQAALKK